MTTPTVPAVDIEQEIKNILSTGATDVEGATSKIMALIGKGESLAPVAAFKSFVGEVLKSGRGGAILGVLGSMGASAFVGSPAWMVYGVGVMGLLALTAPKATNFYSSNTKGEPVWALALIAVAAAVVGGAALWVFDHVTTAMVSSFVQKL